MDVMSSNLQSKQQREEVNFETFKEKKSCFHGMDVETIPSKKTFKFREVVSSYRFPQVYRAQCPINDRCVVVVKPYNLEKENHKDSDKKEYLAFSRLADNPHRNFIKCYGRILEGNESCLILEDSSVPLKEYIRKYISNIEEFNELAFQMIDVFDHLRTIKLLHGDISWNNFLFSNDDKLIKIIDFGKSSILEDQKQNKHLVELSQIALLLLEAQFHIGGKNTETSFEKYRQMLIKTRSNSSFFSENKQYLFENEPLWSLEMSEITKRLLITLLLQGNDHVLSVASQAKDILKPRVSLRAINT